MNASIWESLRKDYILRQIVISVILLLIVILVRIILIRLIVKKRLHKEAKRNWIIHIKNSASALFLCGLIIIWARELQAFTLSITAIAVALIIAFKEFILCLTGGLLKSITHPFVVGDRIEINDLRGDVLGHNFLTTTLLEIGPNKIGHRYTGRSITIPNSVFFQSSIINETFNHKFVLHVFCIPMHKEADWQAAEQLLLQTARNKCSIYLEEAQRYMNQIGQEGMFEAFNVEPRTWVHIPEPNQLNLWIRIPTPAPKKGQIEQDILREFLVTVKEQGLRL